MRVDMKGAIAHTGFTDYALRKAIWAKKIPYFQTGRGKYIFDTELLDFAIRRIMLENMGSNQDEWKEYNS